METREKIESGKLELYVYGLLDAEENLQIARMARERKEVRDEIEAIENAMIGLSSGFAPELPADNFESIREKLELRQKQVYPIAESKPEPETETHRTRSPWTAIGWIVAVIGLGAAGYLFYELREQKQMTSVFREETSLLTAEINQLQKADKEKTATLLLIRDSKNKIIPLLPQPIAPEASARIYWNADTQAVTVDASTLPDAPEGMVYQAWAIYYKPFRAESIGLLENGSADKLFQLHTTSQADAFGITLEPAGGSEIPTLEQLFVIGKVQ